MKVGDIFVYTKSTDKHKWIVVCSDASSGLVLIVNLTTSGPGKEDICVLKPQDHPLIEHDSVPYYRYTQLVQSASLEGMREREELVRLSSVTKGVLARIQEGAAVSVEIKRRHQRFLAECQAQTAAP